MSGGSFLLDGNYKLLLTELGVDLYDFLKQAKIKQNLFDLPEPIVDTDEYYRIWDALTNYGEKMLIPFQAGMAFQPEMFSPVMVVALSSENGKSALERIIKYKRLIAPMIFELDIHDTYGDLIIKSDREGDNLSLGLLAFEMIFMNRILSIGTRKAIKPLLVQTYGEIKEPEYEDFFGVKPIIGDKNIIRFKIEDLEKPFLTKNQAIWNFYLKGLDDRLEELERENSFTKIVRTNLTRMLPKGSVTIDNLVDELGVSKRTIQRKLASENTSYQLELDNIREDFAKKYLNDTNISTKEIAFLLGYEEPNSFIRAFKSWTGKNVGEYRSC